MVVEGHCNGGKFSAVNGSLDFYFYNDSYPEAVVTSLQSFAVNNCIYEQLSCCSYSNAS